MGMLWITRLSGYRDPTRQRGDGNESHGSGQGHEGFGSRRHAEPTTSYRNGQVQRGTGEGRYHAWRRRLASDVEGRTRPLLRQGSHGDRRPVHGNQGTARRLLDLAGEIDAGGD